MTSVRARGTLFGLVLAMFSVATLGFGGVMAQTSVSYRLEESAFNGGGLPATSSAASSANYQIRLASIGDSVASGSVSSASYRSTTGFSSFFPVPGVVTNLRFLTIDALEWDPEQSAGSYNLYRDTLGALSAAGYGQCFQQDLPAPSANDNVVPAAGGGYFYLATVENGLREEGTKGADSQGGPRQGHACP